MEREAKNRSDWLITGQKYMQRGAERRYQWCVTLSHTAGSLTLDDMRVVLQEEIVQVFGDEGRHAGVRQSWGEKKNKQEIMDKRLKNEFNGIKYRFSPSLLKFKYRNGAQSESKPGRKSRDMMYREHHLVFIRVYCT